MLWLRLACTAPCVLIEWRAGAHVVRASQHPALHACPGLVLTCSAADRAEHHAFAVRRPSWIDLRPASDVNRLNTPRSTSRKSDVHVPLLPFGVQPLAGHPVKAHVRSNFPCRQRRRLPPPCRIDQTMRTDAALLQHQNSEAFIRRSEANARTLTDRYALFHLL